MNIVFLCGSLEPDKDGVGDYTRRLAGELIRMGHQCSIIGLMDKFVTIEVHEFQQIDSKEIEVLRLPYNYGYCKNIKAAKKWIDIRNPDWISLQYVPFAFQKKGLPFSLGIYLSDLSKERKFQIMFHELYVGLADNVSIKLRVWGFFQKFMIKKMIQLIKPSLIHTHTAAYKLKLEYFKTKVNYLPLFSNISVLNKTNSTLISDNFFRIILFGTIHSGAPIDLFAQRLKDFRFNINKDIKVIFVGKSGIEGYRWVSVLNKYGIECEILGEQLVDAISLLLSKCDVGITTNPLIFCEKSGTVAAMIEHGLPVISVARSSNSEIKNFILAPNKFIYEFNEKLDITTLKKRSKDLFKLTTVVKIFETDLINCKV